VDDLIKTIRIECIRGGQNTARGPHAVLRAFRKIVCLFLRIAKCRNIVKWYCGQWRFYA